MSSNAPQPPDGGAAPSQATPTQGAAQTQAPGGAAPPQTAPSGGDGGPPSGPGLRFGGMSPQSYWKKNIICVLALLVVWFLVSYGCGILWADSLDESRTPGGGIPLGFWFAQQGSIYVFVALIFFYARRMAALDRQHGVEED